MDSSEDAAGHRQQPGPSAPTGLCGDKRPRSDSADVEDVSLSLTEQESKLFALLRRIVAESSACRGVTLRVAGGWVRDKLIGTPSDDIDIAVDLMSGVAFAEACVAYEQRTGEAEGKTAHFGTIKANPEQSKNLETATMRMCGIDVDFCNLRAEDYADGSRIPSAVRFGTPHEDAHRRDLTFNALYYNIMTDKVEDWTHRGILDLRAGLCCTPLPALTTFHDDPLRVLRCVRFAARLSFSLDPDIVRSAVDPSVHQALLSKVSRERFGIEVGKSLASRGQLDALTMLLDLDLIPVVFHVPPPLSPLDLAALRTRVASARRAWADGAARSLPLILAVVLYPLQSVSFADAKGRVTSLIRHVILESLKLPRKLANDVATIAAAAAEFARHARADWTLADARDAVQDAVLGETTACDGSAAALGWSVRRAAGLWQDALSAAVVCDPVDEDGVQDRYAQLVHRVETLRVADAAQRKPLINGRDVMQQFHVQGRDITQWLARAMTWQFAVPDGTRAACLEFLGSIAPHAADA